MPTGKDCEKPAEPTTPPAPVMTVQEDPYHRNSHLHEHTTWPTWTEKPTTWPTWTEGLTTSWVTWRPETTTTAATTTTTRYKYFSSYIYLYFFCNYI